jgi:hypothetical protein
MLDGSEWMFFFEQDVFTYIGNENWILIVKLNWIQLYNNGSCPAGPDRETEISRKATASYYHLRVIILIIIITSSPTLN